MPKRFSKELLRRIRNDIEINTLIELILQMQWRTREEYFRFLCPVCGEFNTATNPATNLGRCFCCQRNFNTIDLVMICRRYAFTDAVKFLRQYLQPQTAPQVKRQEAGRGGNASGGRLATATATIPKTGQAKRKHHMVSQYLKRLRKQLEAKTK